MEPVREYHDPKEFRVVRHNVEKVDAVGLVMGNPAYVDDLTLPHMLHAKILHSPHAHARILSIDTTEAEKVPGVRCILVPPPPEVEIRSNKGGITSYFPRVPHTTAGQGYPEPSPYDTVMFDYKVRYVGDRVALVAAETECAAEEAVKKISVEYEVLPAVFDPEEAVGMKPYSSGAPPVIHDEKDADGIYDASRNLAAHIEAELGDVEKALAESHLVVEGRYDLGYAQHCPLEPHAAISFLDEKNRLVIRTATQVPFHARRICAQVLGVPVRKIRVIKPRIGGGFGAKQEVILDYLVGAVTLRTGRPCRLVMTRAEEFVSSRTRHPHVIWLKIGVREDGTVKALRMHALSNTGWNGSHSLTVVCNAGSKTLPLYNKAEAVYFRGDAAYTNLPAGGAYRGYGGTQGYFALECLMDEIAEKMKIDPVELRLRNHIREGGSSPVFAALGEGKEGVEQTLQSVGLDKCLTQGAEAFGWKEKRARPRDAGPKKRGVGMCALMQGSGIPEIDMGAAWIKMNEDGSFNLAVGATDLGTGSDTVLSQIAAEVLKVPVEKIVIASSDTDNTPFDVGAYASSTTYISGSAAKRAAENLAKEILAVAAEMLGKPVEDLYLEDGRVKSKDGKSLSYEQICLRALYGQNQRQPQATASFVSPESPPPFAAHFAEVEVDTETGLVKVLDYVAACDCGVPIHPRLAEGQVEGAVLNGITYALTEEYVFDEKGRMTNASFSDYKIYSTKDAPPIRTILVESYEPSGPFGAKSIAEININGPVPAIANAVYNACGIRLKRIPFTPEAVLEALDAKKAEAGEKEPAAV